LIQFHPIKKPEPKDSGISFTSFRMDLKEGFTMKSSDHFVIFLFTFPFAFEREQEYPETLYVRSGWTSKGGFTRKSSDHFVIFLFTFPFAFEREHETLYVRSGWT